mgnify:FL=1
MDNRPKKLFKKIIISLLVLGLFLPLEKRAYAEVTLKSLLKEIAEKVTEIADLRKDKTLSSEDRIQKEMSARREALLKIFDLTLLEDSDLKTKLTGIKNLNADQEKIRVKLLGLLTENESSYSEMKTRLDNAKSIEEVKQLAADFKNWRSAVYNSKVEKIVSFTLVFQQKKTLGLSFERLEKIKAELKKMESEDLIKKEDTEKLLQKSLSNLEQAGKFNDRAEAILLIALAKEFFPPKSKIMTKPVTPPEMKLTDENNKESPTVKSLVKQSLLYTKLAYKYFIEIGKIAKEKVGAH